MKVCDLQPGDVIGHGPGFRAMVVCVHRPHPVWPGLDLVVWRLGVARGFEWSLDALNSQQEVGELLLRAPDAEGRAAAVRLALTGSGVWE